MRLDAGVQYSCAWNDEGRGVKAWRQVEEVRRLLYLEGLRRSQWQLLCPITYRQGCDPAAAAGTCKLSLGPWEQCRTLLT